MQTRSSALHAQAQSSPDSDPSLDQRDEQDMSAGTHSNRPQPDTLTLSFEPTRVFQFTWKEDVNVSCYRLMESSDGQSTFVQVGDDIPAGTHSLAIEVSLFDRRNAVYRLQYCYPDRFVNSLAISVNNNLTSCIGYFKAKDAETFDNFGSGVALSADGQTMAVGASAAGFADQIAGAVYVFRKTDFGQWSQQEKITGAGGSFGSNVCLSKDGLRLAVSAEFEGDGSVYVYKFHDGHWIEEACIKPNKSSCFGFSISLSSDGTRLAVGAPMESGIKGGYYVFSRFEVGSRAIWEQEKHGAQKAYDHSFEAGNVVRISGNGQRIAVSSLLPAGDHALSILKRCGSDWEEEACFQLNAIFDLSFDELGETLAVGDAQADQRTGSVLLLSRSEENDFVHWHERNISTIHPLSPGDRFGYRVSLNSDGSKLAVSAIGDNHSSKGVHTTTLKFQAKYPLVDSGAVHLFQRRAEGWWWEHTTYLKAPNADVADQFGNSIHLSGDGNTLAVGAELEGSSAVGIQGNNFDNSAPNSGAVYLF